MPLIKFEGPVADELQRVDARVDQWPTEVLNEAVGAQFRKLDELLAAKPDLRAKKVKALIASDLRCSPLRPAELKTVFQGKSLTVRRQSQTDASQIMFDGQAGLLRAIGDLTKPYQGDADVHLKAKLVGVTIDGSTGTTDALIQIVAHRPNESIQQNATWHCIWDTSFSVPKLKEITATDYQEVVYQADKNRMFSDCTQVIVGHNPWFDEQSLHGIDHWRARLEYAFSPDMVGSNGLAVGDIDGDGLDDVYLCEPGGLPNRLLVQQADGRVTDFAAQAGVDWMERTYAALIVDLDNDGDQDLAIAAAGALLLHENKGDGQLALAVRVPTQSGLTSLAAADFDSDGDLDIFVCGYTAAGPSREQGVLGLPVPYHDAENGGANLLLRNEGAWQYANATDEAGLSADNHRFSWAAAWEDFDNDGDLDLYVANDFGRNNLFENQAGKFVDVAAKTGVEDISAGMSVSWGDYNNDGLMDIYVSNMFSAAGHRITYQRKFRAGGPQKTVRHYQRHARGNTLFENAGDGTFRDVSLDAGVTMGRWAWGSRFVDFNNDGLEDIFVVNGFVTNEKSDDL